MDWTPWSHVGLVLDRIGANSFARILQPPSVPFVIALSRSSLPATLCLGTGGHSIAMVSVSCWLMGNYVQVASAHSPWRPSLPRDRHSLALRLLGTGH